MLFELGQVVATPGAIDLLDTLGQDATNYLHRHASGDWGDLDEHDRQENEFAVDGHLRIFSSYKVGVTKKIWIITEADRSSTTVLLPGEY